MWRVTFEDGSSVYLSGETAECAAMKAKVLAWIATGRWWNVNSAKQETM